MNSLGGITQFKYHYMVTVPHANIAIKGKAKWLTKSNIAVETYNAHLLDLLGLYPEHATTSSVTYKKRIIALKFDPKYTGRLKFT